MYSENSDTDISVVDLRRVMISPSGKTISSRYPCSREKYSCHTSGLNCLPSTHACSEIVLSTGPQ